jgi:hypothetical protein
MLTLKQRTIWKKQVENAEGGTLIVCINREQVIRETSTTPGKMTRMLEISSSAEDRRGQSIKRRIRITVNDALLGEIKEAFSRLAHLPVGSQHESTVEIRCECSGKLVITRESPPFTNVSDQRIRYAIGNGKDVRFVFDDFNDLDRLRWDLENVTV